MHMHSPSITGRVHIAFLMHFIAVPSFSLTLFLSLPFLDC